MRRLTDKQHVWDSAPSWSADGKTIIFAREYKDDKDIWQEEIWLMNPDGSNKRQIKALEGRAPSLMPDGRILFQSKDGPSQISIADIDGNNIVQLTHDETKNMSPMLSPDGKQIVYLANRDGNQEVYVMDVDGTNQQRITRNRIEEWDPSWSSDGSKITFSSQSTFGFYDIYIAEKDGSGMKKIIQGGSQGKSIRPVITLP